MIIKTLLFISLMGSVLFYLLFVSKTLYICDIYCSDSTDYYHKTTLFFPFILIFSILTYLAPDRVFQSWWKFARIATPVSFALSLFINLELHHNPNGQWQDIFDILALILIYGVFTLGSIWQIWKGFKQK